MLISLGPRCHAAGNLKFLGLRKISLPFDWNIITDETRAFEYFNSLINSNFKYFIKDLKYVMNYEPNINRNVVVSNHYEYVQFIHYDLIKNINIGRNWDNDSNLKLMMERRAKRFMDIISDSSNDITFFYMINYNCFFKNTNLYNDMINFSKNKNIKSNFKVIVYYYNDVLDTKKDKYITKPCGCLPEKFKNIHNFIFHHYVRRGNQKFYGDKYDFKNIIETYCKC